VHDGGIRDGLIQREIAEVFGLGGGARRRRGPEDRLREVRRFAAKCNYEKADSEHVAALSLRIFDQLRERLGPEREAIFTDANREILESAAVLRDVGYLVNYSRHHKHSYHLIVHSDVGGFSPRELELAANIARYHRRALPKRSHPNFANLASEDRKIVRALAGILRIADGLDRTHTQSVTDVHVEIAGRSAVFHVDSETSPSVNIWGAERKARLFQEFFDLEPRFRWTGQPDTPGGGNGAPGGGGSHRDGHAGVEIDRDAAPAPAREMQPRAR
jgi:exopolyphosphatase/guanosine-5'-triphosphate,3'-diphosphate pyrophosphatase